MAATRKKTTKPERWFRCPKCLQVMGPYPPEKEVVFCPHCRTITMETSREEAKKKPLFG